MSLVAPLGTRVFFLVGVLAALVASWRFWRSCGLAAAENSETSDILMTAFFAGLTVIIGIGWVGVLLASFGILSLLFLGAIAFAMGGALWWLGRESPRLLRSARLGWLELALLVVLLGSVVVYFRPHEYVLGGTDAGTYVNIAATLARTGDFVIHDDWGEVLGAHAPTMLREQPGRSLTRFLQFVGWYVDDADSTRWIPQFFPLHPVLLSIGTSLAGLQGSLSVTPIWGVLDILVVFLLARQLFGSHVATLAATFLAVTPLQIWFARYPTTEPLTLLLVFAALLALQLIWDDREGPRVAIGVFGGAALGAAFLTRIDLPLVLVVVLGFLVLRWLTDRWHSGFTAFSVSLGVLTVHATISALLTNWPYTWNTYSGVLRSFHIMSAEAALVMAMGGTVVALPTLWLAHRHGWLPKVIRVLASHRRSIRLAITVPLMLLSLYAYFIRPNASEVPYVPSWPLGDSFPLLSGENWPRIGWYLTPLGLFLATVGAVVIVYRKSLWRMGLFLSVGLLTTVQYVHNAYNTTYQIYMMRRYVPIVIPMLLVYAAYAVSVLLDSRRIRRVRVLGGALAVILVTGMLYQSRFVLPQRDFAGLVGQLGSLNAQLRDDAIVIVAEPPTSALADRFGAPLRFIFGHEIATVRADDAPVSAALEDVLAYASDLGRPVELLAAESIPESVRRALVLAPSESVSIHAKVLESTYFSFPSQIQPVVFDLDIYHVVGLADGLPGSTYGQRVLIDIGGIDTQYILDGFHGKERWSDGATVRWTAGSASMGFPCTAGSTSISVRARTVDITGSDAGEALLYLDGEQVGRFTPNSDGWQTYEFHTIASPDRGFSRLSFDVDTFSPQHLQISSDGRDLGLLLDWVEIHSLID